MVNSIVQFVDLRRRDDKVLAYRVEVIARKVEVMKLALVSAKYPFGGKEPYLDAELRALAPYFSSITVFPTSPPAGEAAFANLTAGVERRRLFGLATLYDALRAIVGRPLACASAVSALLGGAYRTNVKLKNLAIVPLGLALGYRLRHERYDHVHSYWLSTPSSVAFLAARVAAIPWSSTAHQWDIYEASALRAKASSARFIRVISARGRDDLVALAGPSACRYEVVHVGVTIPPQRTLASAPSSRPFSLICAANLVPKKGHAVLLDALAMVRERGLAVRCTLAGDGELGAELRRRVADAGLAESVVFRGHVGHGVLLGEIENGAYDAMVLASIERPGGLMEGIPVALMESMARGLPVIVTDGGSVPELVDDACGRVVRQGDARALAAAIEAFASDPALRANVARAAYDRVRASFDVATVARAIAELIHESPLAERRD